MKMTNNKNAAVEEIQNDTLIGAEKRRGRKSKKHQQKMDFGNPDIIMFGMMSSVKTGHVAMDMVICLFLPVFFRYIFQ